jgi:uncharacterized membrane protein YfcA
VTPDLSVLGGLLSPGAAVAALLLTAAAAFVQAGLGVGFGLVAAPLLALLDPALAPAPVIWLGATVAALSAWRERARIAWGEVGTGLIGRFAGVAAATGALALLPDRDAFATLFGALTLAAVALSASGWRVAFTRARLVGMATLSGLMGTITSIGAPPMAILYAERPPGAARPTLQAFFAIGAASSLVALHASGWADWRDPARAAVLAPGMLAGVALARRWEGGLERRWKPALLALAGCAAAALIARGLG